MIRGLFWATIAGLVIGGASLLAPKAHSEPSNVPYAVCAELESEPTEANLVRILEYIKANGLTEQQSADLVVGAVGMACPRYLPLLQRFADAYGPGPGPEPKLPAILREVIA